MSREGDGMGDVIRKAAAPAGEGSYKKVRDKKELSVCQQLGSWREGERSKRCPAPSQGAGVRVPEQGSAQRCLTHRQRAANLPPRCVSVSLDDKRKHQGMFPNASVYLETTGS